MSVSQTHITRPARSTTSRAAGHTSSLAPGRAAAHTPALPAPTAGRTSGLTPRRAPARTAGQASSLAPGRAAGPRPTGLAPLTRTTGQIAGVAAGQAPATTPAPLGEVGRVGLTREQVMTATEVAELLALPVSTVYYLARQGRLPASRLGRAYRFLRPALERLLEDGGL